MYSIKKNIYTKIVFFFFLTWHLRIYSILCTVVSTVHLCSTHAHVSSWWHSGFTLLSFLCLRLKEQQKSDENNYSRGLKLKQQTAVIEQIASEKREQTHVTVKTGACISRECYKCCLDRFTSTVNHISYTAAKIHRNPK